MRRILVFPVLILLAAGCPKTTQLAAGPAPAVEAWLVTELQGQRIGYSVTRVERFDQGWRFESTMRLEIAMMGVEQKVSSRSVATTAPDLSLESVTFRFESQGRVMEAAAVVQENDLIIKPLGDRPRVLKLDGPVYPAEALGRLVIKRGTKPGEKFEVPVFDVTTMTVDRVTVEALGWEDVRAGDLSFRALKVRTTSSMFAVTTWLDSSGLTVVEEAPPGLRSVRSTPADAVASAGNKAGLDLLRMFRVPVDTLVPEPGLVRRAVMRITGISADELADDYDCRPSSGADTFDLVIRATEPPAGPLALPVPGQDSFLVATVTIQCDAPELRERAMAALAGETDAVAAARILTDWVYRNVEKAPTASFPTALDVLRNLRGDCNEHAVLYAGLARAIGLPCRVAVGLVYMERAFYYHAWDEVWLGKWVAVDPTFGEFPAGALHLKLAGGELREQSAILPLVGRIGIRILELE